MLNNNYTIFGYPYPIGIQRTPPTPRKIVNHTNVLDMYELGDNSINWYPIEGYYGYEVNQFGYVRSLKLRKKYPYGLILKTDGKSYKLQDGNGHAQSVTMKDVWFRAMNNPAGQAHKTSEVVTRARNNPHFHQSYEDYNPPLYKNPPTSMFTVIPDDPIDYTSKPAQFTIRKDYVRSEPKISPRGGYCPIYLFQDGWS